MRRGIICGDDGPPIDTVDGPFPSFLQVAAEPDNQVARTIAIESLFGTRYISGAGAAGLAGMSSMKIMDRYLLINFFVAYMICFTSMVGLFIVIDLFSNADEFLEDHAGTVVLVRRASKYYFLHSFEYFARLSPIITQIAAMVTLASLHRHNELVALLAAGIPTRRALTTVLFGVMIVIGLGVANREIVLPRNSELLQRLHEDIEATKVLIPANRIDRDNVLFRGSGAYREDQRIDLANLTIPMEVAGQLQEVIAERMYYREDEATGKMGWHVVGLRSPFQLVRPSEKMKVLPNGDLFIFSNVTFTDMIRKPNWTLFASITDLVEQLHNSDGSDDQNIRAMIHNRLMNPVLNMLLVLIGVPFVLQWENRNVYRSVAVSMVLSGLFFVTDSTSSYFASFGYVDPLTAAWIPVFLFGPISFSLLHRMGT